MKRTLTWLWLLFACSLQGIAQTNPYIATGIIKNENGEGLQGAVVHLQNDSNGYDQSTTTNGKGIFSFPKVPVGAGYRFTISYVGYASDTLSGYEMKENGRISLSISMQTKNANLDKVVVIGYGTMRKKDLSAAVSEVPDMSQIKERPVMDVATMIQGKVPGITVVSEGGHPDQTPTITIRGKGSTLTESVLIVVDGVPGAPYNPADIVSITILKDAASAAIYGAFAGASGVILITTRQAAQGNPGIEYTAFAGAKTAWRLPQSLTAAKTAEIGRAHV